MHIVDEFDKGDIYMLCQENKTNIEENLWWKTTFGGRRALVEDDLRWKMTFGERQPLVEDEILWKIAFSGK